jgi:hypothetical protein
MSRPVMGLLYLYLEVYVLADDDPKLYTHVNSAICVESDFTQTSELLIRYGFQYGVGSN